MLWFTVLAQFLTHFRHTCTHSTLIFTQTIDIIDYIYVVYNIYDCIRTTVEFECETMLASV